jgi:hypothetical protein
VEGRFSHGLRRGLRSSARFAGWLDMRSIYALRLMDGIKVLPKKEMNKLNIEE